MLQYLIQVIGFQLIFLLVYDLLLRKETFFNYNRLYLLATIGLSFVLPFIKINKFQEMVPEEYVVRLPEVVIGDVFSGDNMIPLDVLVIESSSFSLIKMIFFIGFSMALIVFLRKLYKIYALANQNPKERKNGLVLVKLFDSNVAFSFFNLVFIGETLQNEEKETILKHEIIHVKQRHTIDLLIFEMLRIAFWFNPLIYIYQNRVSSLHEFIADSLAINQQNKKDYYQSLLEQVFDTKAMSFTNTFFSQSLIKKRIVMLTKERSRQILKLKYVLLIPVVCSMLFYSSCSAKKSAAESTTLSVNKNSDLVKKINAVREQIQVQGNITDEEDKGINLLLSIVEGKEMNQDIINAVHQYISKSNKTPLETKISAVLDQIQAQGNVTPYEKGVLHGFLAVTTKDGLNNPTFEEAVESVEVPFGVIDQVPVHEACKTLTNNEERKKCMASKIAKHVNKNFNIKIASDLGLEGMQRINVIFKIDKEGNVTSIRSRAPHPELEKEAIRVIGTLPKFIPGKHQGKAVIVPYSLPIIFKVESRKLPSEEVSLKTAGETKVSFSEVDTPPVLESCASIEDIEAQKKCTSNGVSAFVNKNFNMDLPQKLGLEKGKQHKIVVLFKINKQGNAEVVKVRAPHPGLEEEVKRIIDVLPKFIPGKHKGELVDVEYSLPIAFFIAA